MKLWSQTVLLWKDKKSTWNIVTEVQVVKWWKYTIYGRNIYILLAFFAPTSMLFVICFLGRVTNFHLLSASCDFCCNLMVTVTVIVACTGELQKYMCSAVGITNSCVVSKQPESTSHKLKCISLSCLWVGVDNIGLKPQYMMIFYLQWWYNKGILSVCTVDKIWHSPTCYGSINCVRHGSCDASKGEL